MDCLHGKLLKEKRKGNKTLGLLQNNNITGGIPPGLGNLRNLQTLDLSNNKLSGSIPESLGLLNNLQYLRLNNNTLSGAIPLTRLTKLTFLDLSFNNLSGPVAKFPATTFKYASPAENNSIFVKVLWVTLCAIQTNMQELAAQGLASKCYWSGHDFRGQCIVLGPKSRKAKWLWWKVDIVVGS
ncbi:hypothetical protein POM88_017867 [Heracleum sosnowskyi]|uniref:Uncharacterized protein n=1 Tax=Heracleum sosnowskyi TaxID=360622 RepID=A0AAD8MYD7_9APIA|nr:hypothetical protein POM88_017867 [Heracleum sosnowskyi]